MPLIYRSMTRDGNRPGLGSTARALGVRVPGDLPDLGGLVVPGTGGMSVSRAWREMPAWRIPIRLKPLEPKAAGKQSDLYCWSMGEGPFARGYVADGLRLRPDDPTHALVEPSDTMTIDEFQLALAATRDQWRIDED